MRVPTHKTVDKTDVNESCLSVPTFSPTMAFYTENVGVNTLGAIMAASRTPSFFCNVFLFQKVPFTHYHLFGVSCSTSVLT